MTFDDKIVEVLKSLSKLEGRKGSLRQVLGESNIDYKDSDIPEFRKFFLSSNYVDALGMPNDDLYITLYQTGIDHIEGYENKKKEEKRDTKMKELQLIEMQKKVEILEDQIRQQSEFWKTSIQKNKEQVWTIWIALILAAISLLMQFLQG